MAKSGAADYPDWFFYPSRTQPPAWVHSFVETIAAARGHLDSSQLSGISSDAALAILRPGLEALGFVVEADKQGTGRITRPVLFGEKGVPLVKYDIDGWHPELKIALEVEAGRGMKGNALYRDLIRTPLIFDAEYLAVGVLQEYRFKSGTKTVTSRDYKDAKSQLDAIYASGRLQFPFKGILLFGY